MGSIYYLLLADVTKQKNIISKNLEGGKSNRVKTNNAIQS